MNKNFQSSKRINGSFEKFYFFNLVNKIHIIVARDTKERKERKKKNKVIAFDF